MKYKVKKDFVRIKENTTYEFKQGDVLELPDNQTITCQRQIDGLLENKLIEKV